MVKDPALEFAEQLLRQFIALCENPRTRKLVIGGLRTSLEGAKASAAIYKILNGTLVSPLARATGVQASALKMELIVAQLIGLGAMRYVLRIEPAASAPVNDIVKTMAPAIVAILKA